MGVRYGYQGIDLVEQVAHDAFFLAFNAALSLVKNIILNLERGILQGFVPHFKIPPA